MITPNQTQRVIVMRALRGLGDFLCATPALRALRGALPDAHVTLLGLAETRELSARYPHLIDEHLLFPGFPGIPEVQPDIAALPAFFQSTQGRYDLAIQMHGSGTTSNAFTQLLGARVTAGSYLPRLPVACPDPRTFVPWAVHAAEPQRLLRITGRLGLEARGEQLEFPITARDEQTLRDLPEYPLLHGGNYVVMHPGASEPRRRWNAGHFARVADELAASGLRVVLTGTPGEAEITAAVRTQTGAELIDLTGRTPLGTLAALLRGARLLVCNDTGVSHLAAATRTPSVIVFLASDPLRWAPTDRRLHRPLGAGSNQERERASDLHCLADGCNRLPGLNFEPVTPRDVLRQAHDLLQLEVTHA